MNNTFIFVSPIHFLFIFIHHFIFTTGGHYLFTCLFTFKKNNLRTRKTLNFCFSCTFFFPQGDHLVSECSYNSMERSSITLGGQSTRDEMCLTYLFYWPRAPLSLCHSKPSLDTILQSLGIQELSQ